MDLCFRVYRLNVSCHYSNTSSADAAVEIHLHTHTHTGRVLVPFLYSTTNAPFIHSFPESSNCIVRSVCVCVHLPGLGPQVTCCGAGTAALICPLLLRTYTKIPSERSSSSSRVFFFLLVFKMTDVHYFLNVHKEKNRLFLWICLFQSIRNILKCLKDNFVHC